MNDNISGRGVDSIVGELDLLSQEVLVVLAEECDGVSDSRELRGLLGLDHTRGLLYRFKQKLVPMGLVEIEQPELEGGQMPPKVVRLTGDGREVAGQVDVDDAVGEASVRERLNRLERLVDEVDESVGRLERSVGLLAVASGVGVGEGERVLPSVVALRAGFTGVDAAVGELSGGEVDLWGSVGKLAVDRYEEVEGEVGDLSEVVDGVRGELGVLEDEVDGDGSVGGGV